jgi:Protein of unknown function (DUF3892)
MTWLAVARRGTRAERSWSTVADFQIVEVHTEPSSVGGHHEHIAAVKLRYGAVLPRSIVIQDIRYGTDSYYTYVDGVRADVTVGGCPCCTYGDYITTVPDYTPENNLLSLPRF